MPWPLLSDLSGLLLLLLFAFLGPPSSEAQFRPMAPFPFPVADPDPDLRLVLFNPFTGQRLEPLRHPALLRAGGEPTVNGNLVELPQLWQPCSCGEFSCRCCVGVALGLGGSLSQRLCAALEYSQADLGLRLSVELNQRTVAAFGLSARNPPDYCVPLLLPLPLFSCLRLHDIRPLGEGTMQVCLSVVFKVLSSQFFEYRFNCLRLGANGVFFDRDAQQDREQDPEAVQLGSETMAVQESPGQRGNAPNNKLAGGSRFPFHAL
ncbi:uncharacterized protein LOC108098460 [Drosophila ficusphila]|uniref:uncharacterized protein LOC108098460 n=1 Tax=Drosophila ficusphila TaxID=30025 RepID=UPI0007E5EC8F|nr:uncharacterized protein LOC108098460 [Drosophila ficusphila]